MNKILRVVIFLLIAGTIMVVPLMMSSYKQKAVSLTVGFYNVENLFDTEDDTTVNDNEFLPGSNKKWDEEKYLLKLQRLSEVIRQLGDSAHVPEILGLAEVENRHVMEDLVSQPGLGHLKIVHAESPDQRGIDVALLYDTNALKLLTYRAVPVKLSTGYPTRDILYTVLETNDNDVIHVLVNHWPSRIGGKGKTEPKRIEAARTAKFLVDSVLRRDSMAQIIVMGDFNDEPKDASISDVLNAGDQKENTLFNPFLTLAKEKKGSYMYRGYWDMLDQIMISKGFWDYRSVDFVPESARIFNRQWLLQNDGKYQGYPYRTYGGNQYLGGYSDHLPVTIDLYQTSH